MVGARLTRASSICISRSRRSRRVFSKAMVACAAKSVNKEICLSVNGFNLFAPNTNCPDYLIVFEQRQNAARSKTCVHLSDRKIIPLIAFKCCQVGDVFEQPACGPSSRKAPLFCEHWDCRSNARLTKRGKSC